MNFMNQAFILAKKALLENIKDFDNYETKDEYETLEKELLDLNIWTTIFRTLILLLFRDQAKRMNHILRSCLVAQRLRWIRRG